MCPQIPASAQLFGIVSSLSVIALLGAIWLIVKIPSLTATFRYWLMQRNPLYKAWKNSWHYQQLFGSAGDGRLEAKHQDGVSPHDVAVDLYSLELALASVQGKDKRMRLAAEYRLFSTWLRTRKQLFKYVQEVECKQKMVMKTFWDAYDSINKPLFQSFYLAADEEEKAHAAELNRTAAQVAEEVHSSISQWKAKQVRHYIELLDFLPEALRAGLPVPDALGSPNPITYGNPVDLSEIEHLTKVLAR